MLTLYWKQPLPETWGVWQEGWLGRPNSQLEGSGEIRLEHEGFGDMHMRATIAFPAGSRGRGGYCWAACGCASTWPTMPGAVAGEQPARLIRVQLLKHACRLAKGKPHSLHDSDEKAGL